MLLGTSGGSEHPETMIVKQMCINGKIFQNTISVYGIILRGGYPPMLLGTSSGPEHPETMIVQQMCINGKLF